MTFVTNQTVFAPPQFNDQQAPPPPPGFVVESNPNNNFAPPPGNPVMGYPLGDDQNNNWQQQQQQQYPPSAAGLNNNPNEFEMMNQHAAVGEGDHAFTQVQQPPENPFSGVTQDSFHIVLKPMFCCMLFFDLIFFACIVWGCIGPAIMPDNVPAWAVPLGIGAYLKLFLMSIISPVILILDKAPGSDTMQIKKYTFWLPLVCKAEYEITSIKEMIQNKAYTCSHWTTTSTNKGKTTTHHHSAVCMNGIGILNGDEEDVKELSEALGHGPERGHGEPDESLACCCITGCACY